MGRGNTVLLNVSGGELSPELYARLDLPIYQRGNQRVQNYIVQPQGGTLYRNGLGHVHNTRQLKTGRLITFTFSDRDTYVIELTDKKFRFYREFGTILDPTTKNLTAITKANPAVVTSNAHGFTNGQEIFIQGVVGMKELNNQYFLVNNVTTNTFELQNIYGQNVNSSLFNTYVSGGTANLIYSVDTPYEEAHLNELHLRQSADTIYITHQKYAPFKLTRTGHTSWSLNTYTRSGTDPFGQKAITAITKANPGVFTTSGAHNFALDDEVFVASVGGMVEVNFKRCKINTMPAGTTFTLKDAVTGVPLDTTGFTTYTSGGIVIQTKMCPKTLGFTDTRLGYGNWLANPAGLAFSRAPDSTTGATRFDDFTTGVDATHAILSTLAPVFDKIDSVQWIANVNRQIIVGCLSSIRRVHGNTIDDPISPGACNARPINSIGASAVQPYSSGQSIFYLDSTGRRVHTFQFAFQSNDYVTINQNLASNQLGSSNFNAIAQQRGDSGLLWVLRDDGVLLGLTFNELESIFGWHRHYIGGESLVNGVVHDRAKVLSITTEPRLNEESVLWLLVERKIGDQTYRSVEFMKQPIKFVEIEDFFSESGFEAQVADVDRYNSATAEQLKDSVHLDSALTYDGALSTTITMTPSATTGEAMTITASAAFFDSSMVGRQIWKKYDVKGYGGGRAEITGIVNNTQALCRVLKDFDNTAVIPAGSWLMTTNQVFGLLHLVGQEVTLQVDGAPGGQVTVASDGSVMLPSQTSKAHVGFPYLAISTSMNLDVAGERGSAQAKIRKIREILPRFHNTVGAKIGTTLWNAEDVTFKLVDDVTDRPTPLFSGVQHVRPVDSYTRQTKQVVLMQDIPSPQLCLSMDIMVETADD